jgi:hypothetical protein
VQKQTHVAARNSSKLKGTNDARVKKKINVFKKSQDYLLCCRQLATGSEKWDSIVSFATFTTFTMFSSRVTRLGENWANVFFGQVIKITELAKKIGSYFPRKNVPPMCNFNKTWVGPSTVDVLTQFFPHGLMRLDEALSDGPEDALVVLGPEALLPHDEVHQVLLETML